MANALIELDEANKQILALKGEVESALQMATASEIENKNLKDKILLLTNEFAAFKADSEKAINEVGLKLSASEELQKDFEAKVASKAALIVASQGVPPVAILPKENPEKPKAEAPKFKGLKLVEQSIAASIKNSK